MRPSVYAPHTGWQSGSIQQHLSELNSAAALNLGGQRGPCGDQPNSSLPSAESVINAINPKALALKPPPTHGEAQGTRAKQCMTGLIQGLKSMAADRPRTTGNDEILLVSSQHVGALPNIWRIEKYPFTNTQTDAGGLPVVIRHQHTTIHTARFIHDDMKLLFDSCVS